MNKSKKQAPNLESKSGISFSFLSSQNTGSKAVSVVIGTVLSYLLTLALGFGALLTFTTMFAIPIDPVIFGVFVSVYTFVMLVVYQLPKKVVGFTSLGVLILLIAAAFVFWNETISGFGYVRDFVLVGICKSMYWTVPELSYTFTDAMKGDTTFFICLVATLLMTGISYFSIRKINFFALFLFTFPFFECGAAFGCVPNYIWFSLLLSGWTGCFAMYMAAKLRKIRKRRAEKGKSNVTATKRKQSFVAAIGLVVAILTFVMFAYGNFVISVAGYERPEDIKQLRSDFKDSISDFIDYIIGQDHDGSLKEGRLYQMTDRVIKDRRYLTIQMPFREQTYLKGFVGVEYDSDRWLPYTENSEFNKLVSACKSSGYYPQNSQGILANEQVDTNESIKYTAANITISNLRRKKDYTFSAYIPYYGKSFKYTGDTITTPVNKSSYSYTAFMDNSSFYYANLTDLYNTEEFSAIWDEYTKYVRKVYTSVPNKNSEVQKIINDLKDGKKYGYDTSALTNLEVADRIRTYLSKKIDYSLEIDELPAGEDFITWLLSGDKKKGYSAHYATALTVMMRMAGVPTRYVEGYLITREDFKEAENKGNGYFDVDVTDANAHAWIEVYETNYGWIPIEVTPGFYTGSLLGGDAGQAQLDQQYEYEQEGEVTDDAQSEEIEVIPQPEYEKQEEKPSVMLAILKYFGIVVLVLVLIAVGLLILALLVLFIRRLLSLSRRNADLSNLDRKRRVAAIYKYYSSILKFERLNNKENLPYIEYAKYICKNSKFLQSDRHITAMEIFLKYRFSKQDLTDNEIFVLQELMNEYRMAAKLKLSGKEKFKFMFIDNLG